MSINCILAVGKTAILAPSKNAILVMGFEGIVSASRDIDRGKKGIVESRKDHYTLGEDEIYAVNTATGVETNLGDGISVAIPDGSYRIDVRTSATLWEQARNNSTFALIVSGGEIVLASSLPTVVLLSFSRTTTTKISISISGYVSDGRIGLWLSPITPVVTTGPADIELTILENIYEYEYEYTQTAAEYVAAACLTDAEVGISKELYLPMISNFVTSPNDQFAQP